MLTAMRCDDLSIWTTTAARAGFSANADMIFAANVQRVLEVTNHILRHRLTAGAQIGHEINPDHASFVGQFAQLLVGLVPRQISDRATARVRDRDRLVRKFDRLQCGAIAGVTEINQHALRI